MAAAYAAKGVRSLYPWQAAALECGEDGSSLVYCAPTSGGKSLVAEVLMLRRLIQGLTAQNASRAFGKLVTATPVRALLVLPYVSIVTEKTAHLADVVAPLGGKVRGYFGVEQGAPLTAKVRPGKVIWGVSISTSGSATYQGA